MCFMCYKYDGRHNFDLSEFGPNLKGESNFERFEFRGASYRGFKYFRLMNRSGLQVLHKY